jgi:hypothetical protein
MLVHDADAKVNLSVAVVMITIPKLAYQHDGVRCLFEAEVPTCPSVMPLPGLELAPYVAVVLIEVDVGCVELPVSAHNQALQEGRAVECKAGSGKHDGVTPIYR